MSRFGTRMRRFGPVMVLVAVLGLLAGGLPALVASPGGSGGGLAVQAPGSNGSVHSLPWWDPRGWFGGSGTPSTRVLDDNAAAVPRAGRLPKQAAAGPVHRVKELAAKRTEYSRTYQLSDGQQQAVISSGPVNYQDPAGKWAPISTKVQRSSVSGYAFQNVTNVFRSYFGSSASRLIRFDAPGGGWLAVGLRGARAIAPRVAGDTVTYADVAPGVNLSYQVTPRSLTERITLASPTAVASLAALHFVIRTGGGLIPRAQRDGSVTLSRGALPVLTLPAPFMTDARPDRSSPYGYAWSPKVSQHMAWDAAAKTMGVSLSADAGWLGAAARRFPVVIDPTIDISPTPTDAQNVMIEQDTPTTNYSDLYRLSVGTTAAGAVRSLLSFPLGAVPSGTQLSSADLNLYYDQVFGPGTANQTVEVHQASAAWSASTATWNNANGNVGQLGDNRVTVDDSNTADTSASGAWPSTANSNGINGEYRYNQDTTAGDTFTWVPQVTESGAYQVQAHYVVAASSTAASNAPYTVFYNGGSHTYTVNQQSGSAGVWATLGTQNFAAGNTGKIVLGDGPATASIRVEADAVRLTKSASVVANPNVANIWDSFSVRNIVQSWLSGSSANDGFVVKPSDESTLNVGGPRYEASFNAYNGEVVTYPQLVLTYGTPGVTMNPITTIHATGAELSWTPYTDPTPGTNPGDDLAEYQVHRSVFQSFTPAANTLVAPVTSGTTFTDTTNTPTPPGGLGNAFYYMVAVKTKDGTVIPGPVQLVRLPTAGSTIQIIHASGATSLSSAQPTTVEQHITGQPWVSVGDDSATFGTTRSVFSFPAMASAGIPSDAKVNEAHLKLWGFINDTNGGAAYDAYELSQSFTPSQATWDNASSSTAWTTAGGTYKSTLLSQVTGLTNDPERQNWPVTSAVQDWVNTPADEHGLLVKLDSSAIAERELFLDTTAAEAALRPELVVTYTEPTAGDTYYAPQLPVPMNSNASYTVPVTLTNTTSSTWAASDWVLSYHWLAPDGTDVSTSADQEQTALTASMAPSSVAKINAAVKTPDTSASGDARSGYQLAWDLFDKTTGTWLSSGTSTPGLNAVSATRLGAHGASAAAAEAAAMPMAAGNQTVPTLKQAASVEQPSSNLLGLEKFYQYTGVATGSGTSLLNNDDAGNVVWNYNAFSNPSRGFQTFVRLDYNSMDTSESSMGFGWSLQASSLMRLGTPLDFLPNPNPTTVKLTDGDGTGHLFTLNSSTGQWQSPPGVHYFLQQIADCSANGKDPVAKAWLMTAPDRTQFWFDCQGYQTAVVDKNGNEADFTYTQRNSNNSPVKFLDYITDPAGRQTLTISYYAKGDSYQYVDDSTGNLVSATNLTNPDIIDMVKSITAINGRTISFFYDTQGLMSQMTDGNGTSATKTFKFGYDMTQGNKNVKLVSVTDPDCSAIQQQGGTCSPTSLAYYTAPQDPKFKWSLETITDRLQRATGFAYTEPSGGGIQTVVTDPKTNQTTYLMDATGRPIQATNAKSQVTKLVWDSDNNVTSLTQDNGAQTTWTYDPNTGYPLTRKDAQANHDGTAGTTYTYQTSLSGHVAELISELTPQQRLWTFTYDTNGNLKTVTKPLGNASGATAGSYTTKYTYGSSGDQLTSTDPDGNVTAYSDYDVTGYPQQVTDPVCYAKQQAGGTCSPATYAYDATGDVTAVTDPMQNGTSSYGYDVFGRPLQSTVPKTSAVSITTPAPVYDGNGNVTQSTAPNGAVTTYAFDADDELTSKVTPPDTSSSPSPTTSYTYDPDGNLHTQTAPNGNVPGATAGSYTTTFGYDAINELTSVTDPLSGITKYGYDNVGNKTSVTDPDTNQTQAAYNLNHQVTQTTDVAGNTTKTGYDLDGRVDSTTDQNSNTTLYTLDADAEVTQVQVPAQAPGASVTYDTTQYTYDQAGNQTQVISPRGVASGITNAYTTQTKYTADNQVSAVLTPYLPGDPTYGTPAETDYTYDADGRLSSVSAPPSGNSTTRNVTSYGYFDNGWTQDSIDPTGITTSYDYNNLGEQNSRTLKSADGDLTRSMTWGYYPDGKLQSISDQGIPTGLYAEVTQANDPGATASPAGAWTAASCGTTAGCEGPQYETHAASTGTGTDSFTWHLYIPADGNYTVYVKYPVISGAATNASYTVNYSGGTATATVDQTQNNNNGWVALGKWAFTQSGKNQQVSLAENSGGIVVADAVKIVRDNSGTPNTSTHTYTYTYDASGNQTGITDTSPGAAVASYATVYDQDNRTTSVTEKNSSGGTVHTTTYGYDAASNLKSRTHDSAPSSYTYNNLNQLATESDAKSSTDPSPQVSTFTYNPTGQVASETKPNSNTVTSTYYANELLYQQTEKTSAGTLVSSHQYTYDPNGNTTQNVEQLMSADNSGSYLNHTLAYTYDPTDQVATVTTDGTQTESYTHDANNNVTAQTVNGTQTDYNYYQGRLVTASTGGTTADYNYDPFGRLDTVTAAGQTLQSNTYDGFDNLASTSQWNTSTQSMNTTSYTYDSLNRMASQTTAAGTSSFSYLGLSSELASEQDPGSTSKTYDYTPGGTRLSQTTTDSSGTSTPGYYSYNSHSDVEAVTGATGTTTATYGYTAYGNPVTSMFTGKDKNTATASPTSTTQPYNSYRFNAMRWDSSTGQYDMGFRNYDPGLNQFDSRDMYNGALADAGLTTDPFTGSQYAFGDGNPISNVELDGHTPCDAGYCPTLRQTEQVTKRAEQDNPDVPVIRRFGSGISEAAAAPNEGTYERGLDKALAAFKHKYGYIPNDLNSCQANPGGGLPTCGGKDTLDVLHFLHDFLCKESGITCVGAVAGQSPLSVALNMGVASGLAFGGGEGSIGGEIAAEGQIARDARALCGASFASGTLVLLGDGKAVPISSLRPGDKVLATNVKTGKTQPETVTAVEIRHDTNLYDLTVKTAYGTVVIHTTSNHLFWDPAARRWVKAAQLRKGEPLKTPDGTRTYADGGTTPRDHDGWMWDLTIPGNNDHDFYVVATATVPGGQAFPAVAFSHLAVQGYPGLPGNAAVLVHNNSCRTFSFATAPTTPGTYEIVFKNGKIYVGSSATDIHERLHAAFTDPKSAVNVAGLTKADIADIYTTDLTGWSWEDIQYMEQTLIDQYGGIGGGTLLNRRNELP